MDNEEFLLMNKKDLFWKRAPAFLSTLHSKTHTQRGKFPATPSLQLKKPSPLVLFLINTAFRC